MFYNETENTDVDKQSVVINYYALIDSNRTVYLITDIYALPDKFAITDIENCNTMVISSQTTIEDFESCISERIMKVYKNEEDFSLTFRDA